MDTLDMLDLDVPMLVAYNPGIAMMGECPRAPGYRAEYPLYRFFGSNQAIAQAVLVRLPYKLRFIMPRPIYVLPRQKNGPNRPRRRGITAQMAQKSAIYRALWVPSNIDLGHQSF